LFINFLVTMGIYFTLMIIMNFVIIFEIKYISEILLENEKILSVMFFLISITFSKKIK
jgi:hypothetical protein